MIINTVEKLFCWHCTPCENKSGIPGGMAGQVGSWSSTWDPGRNDWDPEWYCWDPGRDGWDARRDGWDPGRNSCDPRQDSWDPRWGGLISDGSVGIPARIGGI